jgi:hypothetical protein
MWITSSVHRRPAPSITTRIGACGAAVVLLTGTAVGSQETTASAAAPRITTACGNACVALFNLQLGSSLALSNNTVTQALNSGLPPVVGGGCPATGPAQPGGSCFAFMMPTSNTNAAEDWALIPHRGNVDAFVAAGILPKFMEPDFSQATNLTFPVDEIEYTPGGQPTGMCLANFKSDYGPAIVTPVPGMPTYFSLGIESCGAVPVAANTTTNCASNPASPACAGNATLWLVDENPNPNNRSGFTDLIAGWGQSFDPQVLTTIPGSNALTVAPLLETGAGVISPTQLWNTSLGPLPAVAKAAAARPFH